jgi:hypothetical protein
VLLGHSKARFNREDAAHSSLQLQQDSGPRAGKTATPRTKPVPKRAPASASQRSTGSAGRTLIFSILVTFGVGLGAVGTYAIAKTGSIAEATQLVREQGQQLIERLWALVPASAMLGIMEPELAHGPAAASLQHTHTAGLPGSRDTQESQARAAAEQRLARQMSER